MRQVLLAVVFLFTLGLSGCGGTSLPDGGTDQTGGGSGGGSVAAGGGSGTTGGGSGTTGGGSATTGGGSGTTGGGTGGGAAEGCTGCHAIAALATGSHQAHVAAGAVSNGFDCATCHVVPTDDTHATQALNLTFGDFPKTGGLTPTYDSTAKTCTNNYCHGSATTTPAWSTTATKLSCDGCHGDPPTSAADGGVNRHAKVATGPLTCNACHGWTVDTAGKILLTKGSPSLEYGGRHLDGVGQGHHPWTGDPPPGHPASIKVDLCNSCHRQQVDATTVCSQCH